MQSKDKTQIGIVLDAIFKNYITSKNNENQTRRNEITSSNKSEEIKQIQLMNIKDLKDKQSVKANLLGWKPEVLSYIEHGDRVLNTEKLIDIIRILKPTNEQYVRLIRAFATQDTEIKVPTVQNKTGNAYSSEYKHYNRFLCTTMEILILLEILGEKSDYLPSGVDLINIEQSMDQIRSKLLDVAEGKKSA